MPWKRQAICQTSRTVSFWENFAIRFSRENFALLHDSLERIYLEIRKSGIVSREAREVREDVWMINSPAFAPFASSRDLFVPEFLSSKFKTSHFKILCRISARAAV